VVVAVEHMVVKNVLQRRLQEDVPVVLQKLVQNLPNQDPKKPEDAVHVEHLNQPQKAQKAQKLQKDPVVVVLAKLQKNKYILNKNILKLN
jgi:hypothetical protein